MEEELACVDETAPIWKYYHQEEDAIMNICMENFISCFLQGKALVIETPVSTWKIITNGQKKSMFLYHRNEMETDEIDNPNALIPNYHSQSCRRNTIDARSRRCKLECADPFNADSSCGQHRQRKRYKCPRKDIPAEYHFPVDMLSCRNFCSTYFWNIWFWI